MRWRSRDRAVDLRDIFLWIEDEEPRPEPVDDVYALEDEYQIKVYIISEHAILPYDLHPNTKGVASWQLKNLEIPELERSRKKFIRGFGS